MEVNVQLSEWVKGNPMHNKDRDECAPDFSCCRGKEYMADEETRKRFYKAHIEDDKEVINQMLMMFLGTALSNKNVHIVGDTPKENQ